MLRGSAGFGRVPVPQPLFERIYIVSDQCSNFGRPLPCCSGVGFGKPANCHVAALAGFRREVAELVASRTAFLDREIQQVVERMTSHLIDLRQLRGRQSAPTPKVNGFSLGKGLDRGHLLPCGVELTPHNLPHISPHRYRQIRMGHDGSKEVRQ